MSAYDNDLDHPLLLMEGEHVMALHTVGGDLDKAFVDANKIPWVQKLRRFTVDIEQNYPLGFDDGYGAPAASALDGLFQSPDYTATSFQPSEQRIRWYQLH